MALVNESWPSFWDCDAEYVAECTAVCVAECVLQCVCINVSTHSCMSCGMARVNESRLSVWKWDAVVCCKVCCSVCCRVCVVVVCCSSVLRQCVAYEFNIHNMVARQLSTNLCVAVVCYSNVAVQCCSRMKRKFVAQVCCGSVLQ